MEKEYKQMFIICGVLAICVMLAVTANNYVVDRNVEKLAKTEKLVELIKSRGCVLAVERDQRSTALYRCDKPVEGAYISSTDLELQENPTSK